jgi:hypothetical protein
VENSKEPAYKYEAYVYHPGMIEEPVRTVTKHIAVLYDLAISMDAAASGYMDEEDWRTVVELGKWCGFELPVCPERYPEEVWGPSCELHMFHEGKHKTKCSVPSVVHDAIYSTKDQFVNGILVAEGTMLKSSWTEYTEEEVEWS